MTRFFPVLLICCTIAASMAAGDGGDHDRARRAFEAGEILPLSRILDIAVSKRPGRVIEVELDRDDGRWIYEIEVLSPEGRVYELTIDGSSGAILEYEGGHD